MIIGYARVSSVDQNTRLQLDALKAAGCEKIYTDKATGRNAERPKLAELRRSLRKGDTVVIWKLDRLGRSLKNLVELVEEFKGMGVEFKSLTETIDTANPAGKLAFHLFGAIAEFEADLIRERTLEGLKAARARGRVGGRKKKLSSIDEKRAAAMLTNPLETKTAVAKHFGVSRPTLNKALKNLEEREKNDSSK